MNVAKLFGYTRFYQCGETPPTTHTIWANRDKARKNENKNTRTPQTLLILIHLRVGFVVTRFGSRIPWLIWQRSVHQHEPVNHTHSASRKFTRTRTRVCTLEYTCTRVPVRVWPVLWSCGGVLNSTRANTQIPSDDCQLINTGIAIDLNRGLWIAIQNTKIAMLPIPVPVPVWQYCNIWVHVLYTCTYTVSSSR